MTFNPLVNPIDYMLINDQQSPGVVEITGAGSPRQWDERRGFGMSGAISVYRGAKLAKFSAAFSLWLPEHFDAWASFAELLAKPPNMRRPRVLTVWHPILEDLGISQAGVEDLLQPTQAEDGKWIYECKFVQYRRPRLALARPDGGDTAAVVDPVDQEIENLTRQVDRLAR